MEEKNKIFFGTNIKYLIRAKNLRQFEFAELFKSKQGTVSNWITGVSYPNFDTLVSLSEYFNISIDNLIFKDLSDKNVNINFLNEPNEEYQKIGKYEVTKIYEPQPISTEGVGIIEGLIKRIEKLEREIKELKDKKQI